MTLKGEINSIITKVATRFSKEDIDKLNLSILSAIKRDKIKKAIEVLGRPVMSYAPKIAMKEYDNKIKDAVSLLNQFLNEVEG
jgi:hypothetical protein